AFLNAALQIVDDERRLLHVLHVESRLGSHYLQAQVEPDIPRDVDRACEARPIVDLPIKACVENRRILQGVSEPGFVLAEIDPFAIAAIARDPKLNTEETAACRRGDIYIDNTVAHLETIQDRRAAIEEEALAALIFSCLGLPLQIPTRGICGNRKCLRR